MEDDEHPVTGYLQPKLQTKPGRLILGRAAVISRYLPASAWSPRTPHLASELKRLVDQGVKSLKLGSPKMMYINRPCPFCELMNAFHIEAKGFKCIACQRDWELGTADETTAESRLDHHYC